MAYRLTWSPAARFDLCASYSHILRKMTPLLRKVLFAVFFRSSNVFQPFRNPVALCRNFAIPNSEKLFADLVVLCTGYSSTANRSKSFACGTQREVFQNCRTFPDLQGTCAIRTTILKIL